MKMMSTTDCAVCDSYLKGAKGSLECCLKTMEGKYGTAEAVSNLKCAIIYINQCIANDKYYTKFYQQFRNPPNTPKSRRLGWHNKGATDEQS